MQSGSAPITSRTNARVKELRGSLSGRAARAGDLLGIEGLHLLGELHAAGHSFETLFLRQGDESVLEVGWPSRLRTRQTLVLSRDTFDSAVTTATPQGVAATWVIREPIPPQPGAGNVLLLEDVQDPGNVGTLIRSAEAFGFSAVAMTPTTANHWNPKVVRASAGSVFRLPVWRAPMEAIGAELKAGGVRLFAAVSSFTGAHTLALPLTLLTGGREDGDRAGFLASLSVDADFQPPCAVLIGNEGAGLSTLARSLADEQVRIPCGTESLNAAVAGSVLMYEVMRQVPLRGWARERGLRP